MSDQSYLAPILNRDIKPEVETRRLRRRRGKETRFKRYGEIALGIATAFLIVLLLAITLRSLDAFRHSVIALPFTFDPIEMGLSGDWGEDELQSADTRAVYFGALYNQFPDQAVDKEVAGNRAWRENRRALREMLPDLGSEFLRQHIRENPEVVGRTVDMSYPLSDVFDRLYSGDIPDMSGRRLERATEAEILARQGDGRLPPGEVSDETRQQIREQIRADHYGSYQLSLTQIGFFEQLVDRGLVQSEFNWPFFSRPNQQSPEFAGLWGAIMGSALTLVVCMILAVPIGVAAAVYLEEFAPKNRMSDIIEININNLAAVPSIIFGLLGLAVFIQFFGVPERTPLVGGMVLALMTLPTIIIAARAAIKAVPPSIREAALGMGASKQQMILHHVLPLARPGILTGSIIGLAQALGETAPLILIGMVSFVTTVPYGLTDPASTLPVQIYLWSDQPQRGFEPKTALAIVVLLTLLVAMNSIAIWARRKYENRW